MRFASGYDPNGVYAGNHRLIGIQYLRGFAALSVVLFHIFRSPFPFGGAGIGGNAQSGVDIFFVISGFIMISTASGMNRTEFIEKRLIRIVPLYWMLTIFYSVAVIAIPKVFSTATVTFDTLVESLLFIPYLNNIHHGFFPLIVLGWTLNLEIFFYALFATMIKLRKIYILFWVAGCFSVLVFGQRYFPETSPVRFYGQTITFEFAFGIALGLFSIRNVRFAAIWGGGMVALSLIALIVFRPGDARILAWGLPATGIVLGTLMIERSGKLPLLPFLLVLGDASYSIYLTHPFVIDGVRFAWAACHLARAQMAIPFVIVCMLAVIGAGILIHVYLEKPLIRKIRDLMQNPRPAPTSVRISR